MLSRCLCARCEGLRRSCTVRMYYTVRTGFLMAFSDASVLSLQVNGLDRSWTKPKGPVATLLDAKAKNGELSCFRVLFCGVNLRLERASLVAIRRPCLSAGRYAGASISDHSVRLCVDCEVPYFVQNPRSLLKAQRLSWCYLDKLPLDNHQNFMTPRCWREPGRVSFR